MSNKTCGECKHCENKQVIATCKHVGITTGDVPGSNCKWFVPKVIPNGDKIRQMSNEELAKKFGYPCPPMPNKHCKGIDNEECTECWLKWLNAPAESEVTDE
jgi:hypothetical protein